jgi:DNA-binding transcriptional LysR family regulator
VILLSDEIAAGDVAAGRTRPILPAWQGRPTPDYALTETRLLPAKTQRFVEFLQERLTQQTGASSP